MVLHRSSEFLFMYVDWFDLSEFGFEWGLLRHHASYLFRLLSKRSPLSRGSCKIADAWHSLFANRQSTKFATCSFHVSSSSSCKRRHFSFDLCTYCLWVSCAGSAHLSSGLLATNENPNWICDVSRLLPHFIDSRDKANFDGETDQMAKWKKHYSYWRMGMAYLVGFCASCRIRVGYWLGEFVWIVWSTEEGVWSSTHRERSPTFGFCYFRCRENRCTTSGECRKKFNFRHRPWVWCEMSHSTLTFNVKIHKMFKEKN